MRQPVSKSAAERLTAVKRDLPKIEQQIDAVMATRRTAVLAGSVADRRRADGEIAQLKLDLQAAHDAIVWLPQQAQREAQQHQQSQWPSSLPDALTARAATVAARERCETIKPNDRSARCQQRIDHLVQREYALTKLIERLRPSEDAA
jgi:hypothetical protein